MQYTKFGFVFPHTLFNSNVSAKKLGHCDAAEPNHVL